MFTVGDLDNPVTANSIAEKMERLDENPEEFPEDGPADNPRPEEVFKLV